MRTILARGLGTCGVLACLACLARYHPLEPVAGRAQEVGDYVARLAPPVPGRKTVSGLMILLPSSEQWVYVFRLPDHFQVRITFCPEHREDQEKRLLALARLSPPDMLTGSFLGETRCGSGRSFNFASEIEVSAFLCEALRNVLGVTAVEYRFEATAWQP